MTGFGAADGPVAGGILAIEIRSVNHRYLQVLLKAPAELAPLEVGLRDRLRRDFERGHVTVQLRWTTSPGNGTGTVRVNLARAREAMARLRELQTAVGLSGEITLDQVARQPDVFATVDADQVPINWDEVEPILGTASGQCVAMRRQEGQILALELTKRLEAIRALSRQVVACAPERLVRERNRLRHAVSELLDGRQVDEQRLTQELAFVADRLDITEELVRLGAHLDVAAQALASDHAVGKQLGFLAQEIGREINTIGSKANDAAMQHAVVDMKGELERFREQLENLE
ncbi:MAG: YicC/YloC family endoribonuclease [Gemmatimonadota bacterium]